MPARDGWLSAFRKVCSRCDDEAVRGGSWRALISPGHRALKPPRAGARDQSLLTQLHLARIIGDNRAPGRAFGPGVGRDIRASRSCKLTRLADAESAKRFSGARRRFIVTTTQAATDFPVPTDLDGFWTWDKMHGPRPMTPMSQEITFVLAIDGFTRAMHEFSAPVGFHARVINYYGYMTVSRSTLAPRAWKRAWSDISRRWTATCPAWVGTGRRIGCHRSFLV